MYDTFALERWQSLRDYKAKYNLSESGIEPPSLKDLGGLPDLELGYGNTQGSPELRKQISSLYHAPFTEENILVTNGGAEANFLTVHSLVEPGDRVAVQMPNYMQTVGILRGLGAKIDYMWLKGEQFQFDERSLDSIRSGTKAVFITNPNNPTGSVLGERELHQVVGAAEEAGAHIVCDEVYRGAELDSRPLKSIVELYQKGIATSSLSKVYGLPGLRTGWIAATKDVVVRSWGLKDYTTISPSVVSQKIAVGVLKRQEQFVSRAKEICRRNTDLFWSVRGAEDAFVKRPQKAAPFLFVKTRNIAQTSEYCERLFNETGVLINPGECFEMPGYVRIWLGGSREEWMTDAFTRLIDYTLHYERKSVPSPLQD